ncbi:MAG: hypothetical protein AAF517_17390 [Planctomycetota bacterium]
MPDAPVFLLRELSFLSGATGAASEQASSTSHLSRGGCCVEGETLSGPESDECGGVASDRTPAGGLPEFLNGQWELGLQASSGRESAPVRYDPEDRLTYDGERFRCLFLPGRAQRPQISGAKPRSNEVLGLRRSHGPCPFDGPEFVRDREVLRLIGDDARYHVVRNHFPVVPRHYLIVRPSDDPAELLPQCLHSAAEIRDVFRFLVALGPSYRLYFNSNAGGDGSHSGSSVNHWHWQFFEYPFVSTPFDRVGAENWPGACLALSAEIEPEKSPASGTSDTPADVSSATAESKLATAIWRALEIIHERDCAYNVEAYLVSPDVLRVILFPRAPGSAIDVPGVGTFPPEFGGNQLRGDFVLTDRELFDWSCQNPDEVDRIMEARLRETTWISDSLSSAISQA